MKKRLFVLAMIVMLSILLFACDTIDSPEFIISDDFIENNFGEIAFEKTPVNTIIENDFGEYTVTSDISYSTGFVVVEDSAGRKTVWSLILNKALFEPKSNYTFYTMNVDYFGNYIVAVDEDGMETAYDSFGTKVIDTDLYYDYNVIGSRVLFVDELGISQYEYYETISTLKQSDYDNGVVEPTIVKYKINIETKQRIIVEEDSTKYFQDEDKLDLRDYGLEGHYLKSANNFFYVFDETDTLVSSFKIPEFDTGTLVNGKFLYQKVYEDHPFSDNYTLLEDGDKFILKSYSLDLLTGKRKDINLKFVISGFYQVYDEDMVISCTYARIRKIESKVLLADEEEVLLDENGKIIYVIPGMGVLNLVRLDDKHYYNVNTKYVYDDKYNPIFRIHPSDTAYINYTDKVFVVRNDDNYYGIIDFDGNILVPFEYSYINRYFVDGKTYGIYIDGNYCFIDINNNQEFFGLPYEVISDGLVLLLEFDDVEGDYLGKLVDLNNNVKLQFYNSNSYIYHYTLSNVYGDYFLFMFYNLESEGYITIDITKK
ncbi:MAG: hypothetical protein PHX62_02110 [Bacilli bacterium]|nr:hypothetical protein [Bacilli bacterium]